MTIKDIEQMRDIKGNVDFYIKEQVQDVEFLIFFKSVDSMLAYVREQYNYDLTPKKNSEKKIIGVNIWRR